MTAALQSEGTYKWVDQLARSKAWDDNYTFSRYDNEFTRMEKYWVSLYWSIYVLTSIGLGDITPTNLQEYIIGGLLMAVSSIFWAYTIGNFCSIVSMII